MMEIHSFITKYHQLCKAGFTAHLDLDTQAGQAWVGLRVQLGQLGQPLQYPPQPRQYPPQSPTHHSPSYYRRQEYRKAAKAANATVTNTEEKSTEKVNHHPQELEP